jgi:methanogenic corrinoid protein MtbC1
MTQDTRYHLEFLAAALWADETALYEDYAVWVDRLFQSLGLPREWLTGSLEEVRGVLDGFLEPVLAEAAAEVIDVAVAAPEKAEEPATHIDVDARFGALALRYLTAILGGERDVATGAVLKAVRSGVSVRDIYAEVLRPAQLELGRLWHMNRITVAQEHFSTAVTQMTMALLYPYMFDCEHHGHAMVATCCGKELHEVGVRMVADFFEMSGWDTYYLGANTPTATIIEAMVDNEAQLLALSATMSFRVPEVARIIESVRADSRTAGVKVLVGGYPFNLVPDLWQRVGADGYAPSAEEAIEVAERLVGMKTGGQRA